MKHINLFLEGCKKILKKQYKTVCACVICLALLSASAYIYSEKQHDQPTASIEEIADWGLRFDKDNKPPTGNVDEDELEKYNAHFIDDSGEKVIYLTFDAGYEAGYTPEILDILKEEQVPATFFLVGNYLKTQPDLVRRMVEEGHTVGNHTASHPDMSTIQDLENFRAELETVERLYTEVTGQQMKKFYRPPQGKFNVNNLMQAQMLGYTTVFWSLAYADWDPANQPTHEYALNKLNSRIHDGAIVLLHPTSSTNRDILKELIQTWKAEGYIFRSVTDLDS